PRKKTEAGSDRGKTEQWWFAVGDFFFVVSGCLCLGFVLSGSLFGVRNVFESRLFVLLIGELSRWFIQRIGWKHDIRILKGHRTSMIQIIQLFLSAIWILMLPMTI
ncbi:hypothetical protein VIGAN_11221600, partial [Vigna angularis var. angularis]